MDSSKLKMYCKNCQAPKSAPRKNFYDKLQRTTECRLQTDAGSVLKIREVNTTLDEEEIWKKQACQCNPPVLGTKPLKNAQKKLNHKKTKNYQRDENIDCSKVLKELKPKWFYQFSDTQLTLLDNLVWDLIDDEDEGTQNRTRLAMFRLGLYPQPSLKQIRKAMIFNSTNPVLFLNDLLSILNHSASEEKSHNQRVLMSGIFYLEMPHLVQTLLPRLPRKFNDTVHWDTKNEKSKKEKKVVPYSNPYLQSLRPKNFLNWQEQRKKTLAARKDYCISRQRIPYPEEALKKLEFLNHIDMSVIDPDIGSSDIQEETIRRSLEKEECNVLKHLREFELEPLAGPDCPPGSRSSAAVRVRIKELLQDKNFNTILGVTLLELANRGMISATYKDLNIHPVLIHLDKFMRGEVFIRELKSSLAEKAATMKHCMKQLYENSKPVGLNKRLPDKTWASIQHMRKIGKNDRKKVLNHLWRQRVQCSQNIWHTFSPEYPQVRSFLPTFSAYTTSYKTRVNLWTIIPKE